MRDFKALRHVIDSYLHWRQIASYFHRTRRIRFIMQFRAVVGARLWFIRGEGKGRKGKERGGKGRKGKGRKGKEREGKEREGEKSTNLFWTV